MGVFSLQPKTYRLVDLNAIGGNWHDLQPWLGHALKDRRLLGRLSYIHDRSSSIRSATRRPETMAVGMPVPG